MRPARPSSNFRRTAFESSVLLKIKVFKIFNPATSLHPFTHCTCKTGQEVLEGEATGAELVAILGLYQVQDQPGLAQVEPVAENTISGEVDEGTSRPASSSTAGRIIVYGDSNCADNSHMQKGGRIVCNQPVLSVAVSDVD